jgi:hypothetical protein
VLQAADLIAAELDGKDRRTLLNWAGEFATAGDRFYAARSYLNTSRINNWMARRLLIRAVAVTVSGLTSLRAELPDQLTEFAARNRD